jgi:hypothetical protein
MVAAILELSVDARDDVWGIRGSLLCCCFCAPVCQVNRLRIQRGMDLLIENIERNYSVKGQLHEVSYGVHRTVVHLMLTYAPCWAGPWCMSAHGTRAGVTQHYRARLSWHDDWQAGDEQARSSGRGTSSPYRIRSWH